MPSDLETKLKKLERHKFERLKKDSETYKIMARVFDSQTLLVLRHLLDMGVIDTFHGVVSTGKEAHIFCALDKKGKPVAVKIYMIATSNFKHMHRYLAGDPRFEGITKDQRSVIFAWASREFRNLQRAYEAGAPVPKTIRHEKNVLVMEFLGRGETPYPRMKDARPKDPDKAFKIIFKAVKLLYQKAKIVHADLSEYNVLMAPNPVIIDFSVGTDIRNPMADELLMHDLETIVKYFRKLGVKTPEPSELFDEVTRVNPLSSQSR